MSDARADSGEGPDNAVVVGPASRSVQIAFTVGNVLPASVNPNQDAALQPTTDYALFSEIWYPRLTAQAFRAGVFFSDIDDCVQDILLKFFENDMLNQYDVRLGHKFSTFVRGNARFMIATFRAKMAKRNGRELRSSLMDASRLGDGDDPDENAPSFAHVVGGSIDPVDTTSLDEMAAVETEDAIRFTLSKLDTMPKLFRNGKITQDYARLFFDMVEMAMLDGEVSPKVLADRYGISRQAVQQHMKHLVAMDPIIDLHRDISRRSA